MEKYRRRRLNLREREKKSRKRKYTTNGEKILKIQIHDTVT